jgi:hypothetical protein
MKNRQVLMGTLVIALVSGFIVVGCPTGNDSAGTGGIVSNFEGTWKNSLLLPDDDTFYFAGNMFTQSLKTGTGELEVIGGGFVFNASVITFTALTLTDKDGTVPWTFGNATWSLGYVFQNNNTELVLSRLPGDTQSIEGTYTKQ